MLGKYFKVTEDFALDSLSENGEYLAAEKGDIIFDVVYIDENYASAKSMLSQRAGKIPRKCIEELQGEDETKNEVEPPKEIKPSDISAEDKSDDKRKSDTDPNTVAISTCRGNKITQATPSQRPMGSFKKPELPKRPAPTCKRTNSMPVTSSFRSRASDEGYNSSSTYSGDRQGQPSKSSDEDCFVDTPLLQSQRPRSLSPTPHKMSVQDEDGYEVPMLVCKPNLKIQGEDTIERRKPKLKFVFRKKLELKNGKEHVDYEQGHGVFRMGCGKSSGFSSPSEPGSPTQSPRKRLMRKERVKVLSCILCSLLISMGLFLILFIVIRLSILLSLVIGSIVFSLTLVIPLTVSRGRVLCMLSLLIPSFFSCNVRGTLCISFAALLIIGPVFNIATNLDLALRCGVNSDAERGVHISDNNSTLKDKPAMQADNPNLTPTVVTVLSTPTIINLSTAKTETKNFSELFEYCKQSLHIVQKMCISTKNVIEEKCKLTTQSEDKPGACVLNINDVCHNHLSIRESCNRLNYQQQTSKPDQSKAQVKAAIIRTVFIELLALLVLVLFLDAYYYTQGYLADKDLDNVYITGKLKVIDHERKERGLKERIFPLRKLEFRKYCLPSSFNMTAYEKRSILRWLCVCSVMGLFLLCLVFLDNSVYDALTSGREPKLLNACAKINFTKVDQTLVKAMYVLFGILVGFSIFQGYVLRCRSRICSSFYPKRETVRGVHLYYKVLQDRAYFWKNCREKVRIAAEARRLRWKTGVAHRIFACLPFTFRRSISRLFIYRCMICRSCSCRRSFVCSDPTCSAVYCFECYIDMGESCISCQPSHQATFSLGSPI